MIDPELEQLARRLGNHREDVRRDLAIASRSDLAARIKKRKFRLMLKNEGIDADDNDPFTVAASAYDFGGDGIRIGTLSNGHALVWRHDEIPYSAICVGAPGFGKTTAVLGWLMQLAQFYTIIVVDLRGDYEALCRVIPGSRFLVFGEFPLNLLRGPSRVPPASFAAKFVEAFTDQFELFQASRRYIHKVWDALEVKRLATGHWPCLLDLKDALESQKEVRASPESDLRNRCLARVDAMCRALGEKAIGVEQGIDLEALIDQKTVLIFRMELERSIQDFLVNWLVMYVFEHRAFAENKFNQQPLVFVLDEQRSILRARR
jgi:hypothetical protein